MAEGQALEGHLAQLMKLFTPSYWPNRAGMQNGCDALARFEIQNREYRWKFESKGHNQRNYHQGCVNVPEIELNEFSSKILEIMGIPEVNHPHVFCLFMPYKSLGNNNILRERADAWNTGWFPFKIIIWDYDFLINIIPFLNVSAAEAIYPEARTYDKAQHGIKVAEMRKIIQNESIDGFLINRAHWVNKNLALLISPEVLCIEVRFDRPDNIVFEVKGRVFLFKYEDLVKFSTGERHSIIEIPRYKETNIVKPEAESYTSLDLEPVIDDNLIIKKIQVNKQGLIDIFKSENLNGDSLFKVIKDFCLNDNLLRVVCFIPDGNCSHLLAHLPINELLANDFELDKNIIFRFTWRQA